MQPRSGWSFFSLHAVVSLWDALHDACDLKILKDALLILLKMHFPFVAPCLAFHICSEAFEPTTLYVDNEFDKRLVASSVPSKRKLEQDAEEEQMPPHPQFQVLTQNISYLWNFQPACKGQGVQIHRC